MFQTVGELREALKDYADDVAIRAHCGNLELTHKIQCVEVSVFTQSQKEVVVLQLD
jgi:hypothetical protein